MAIWKVKANIPHRAKRQPESNKNTFKLYVIGCAILLINWCGRIGTIVTLFGCGNGAWLIYGVPGGA